MGDQDLRGKVFLRPLSAGRLKSIIIQRSAILTRS